MKSMRNIRTSYEHIIWGKRMKITLWKAYAHHMKTTRNYVKIIRELYEQHHTQITQKLIRSAYERKHENHTKIV